VPRRRLLVRLHMRAARAMAAGVMPTTVRDGVTPPVSHVACSCGKKGRISPVLAA
jgi:hypothetical protein